MHAEEGFSLLEMAIVLVVLGIIGGLTLPLLTQNLHRAAAQKTRERMALSMDALAAYVERYERFPCPADPAATGKKWGATSKMAACPGGAAEGILPFRSLGLQEQDVKDGYHHYFTYAVEPNLAKPRANLKEERGGKIRVSSSDGTPVIDEGHEPGAFVAVVLASHGETGQGAYKGNGQRGKIEGPEALPALPPLQYRESVTLDRRLVWESRDVFLKKRVKLKEE